jgi:hypothetical protein
MLCTLFRRDDRAVVILIKRGEYAFTAVLTRNLSPSLNNTQIVLVYDRCARMQVTRV